MIALGMTWHCFIPGLAAKLNAKIIVNGNEFNQAGELSVDDRHLYHEALEALFLAEIAVSAAQPGETNGEKRTDHGCIEETFVASGESSSAETVTFCVKRSLA